MNTAGTRSPSHQRRFALLTSSLACLALAFFAQSGCGPFLAPTITSVEPNSGPTSGGTDVTILGSFLDSPVAVTFNGVAATNVNLIHSQALTATTPAGSAGAATLELIFADGRKVTVPNAFTYVLPSDQAAADLPLTITSLIPVSGPTAGGTALTVLGTNFVPDAVLLIGDQPALDFNYVSSQLITATAPPGAAGTATVTLVTGDGRSSTYPPGYTYLPPDAPQFPQPTITSVSPASGPTAGGAEVTIQGSQFVNGSVVVFGTTAAARTTFNTANVLIAVAPAHAEGPVDVSVVLPDGRRATASAAFTYLAPAIPTIVTVNPAQGPVAGGSSVTVRGTGFSTGTLVFFGSSVCPSIGILTPQALIVETPPGAAGPVDVTVEIPDGRRTVAVDAYTYLADPPQIATLTPDNGPEAGGTLVTITGSSFTGATNVLFGATAAPQFTVLNDNSIQALSPAGTGVVAVQVQTPSGSAQALFTYVAPPAPTISALEPASGPEAGGTAVTITGTGFTGTTAVQLGATAAPLFTVLSDTLIQVVSPAGTGSVAVEVQTPNGNGQALFTYIPPNTPTIGSLSPASGPEAGGTVVTLTGTAFTGTSEVTFGGNAATYTILSDTLIQAITPPGTGSVVVNVETPNGNAQALFTYVAPNTPTIGCLSPASGPVAGGTVVTILGTGFANTTAVVFYIGVPDKGVGSALFTVLSDCELQVLTPSSPEPGTVVVEVQTPNGNVQALYTYVAPSTPTIGSLSPSSGPVEGGTLVLINGTGFTGTTDVSFGFSSTDYEVLSDTQIIALSPVSDPGTYPVIVSTPQGSAAAMFTYVAPNTPTIGGLSPASGPEAGGTVVTITGTAFAGASEVTFDGNAATYAVLSDTLIQAITPPGTGSVVVNVDTPNGNAQALFTYVPPGKPTIGSLSPATGPEAGGTVVTITGTAFTGTSGVTFAGNSATYTVLSDTLIQVVSPAGTGTVVVEVQTPNGNAQALFTYVPPGKPTIGSLSPATGPEAGGTVVTITGTAFTGTSGVTFAGNSATYTVLSDTLIQAVSPVGTGTVVVEVQTPNGNAQALFTYVPGSRPTIGNLCPASGPLEGGTVVTIMGTSFASTTAVVFYSGGPLKGNGPALFTVLSDTLLQVVTPSAAEPGTVVVEIQTPAGNAQALFTYVAPGTPTIGSISPASGPVTGNTFVVITGTGFTDTMDVSFDFTSAEFQVLSDTQILTLTPGGDPGTYPLVVTTSHGTAATMFTYVLQTPAIGNLSPSNGPEEGGTLVVVSGTGFVNASGLFFGMSEAKYETLSDTQILVVSPPGTGTVPVVVVGTDSSAGVALFTYVPPNRPTIGGLSPASGPEAGGTVVTITGTAFTGATGVTLDGNAATYTVLSDTLIQAVSPAGTGTAIVEVQTPNGNAQALFTYIPPSKPAIGSLSPASGPEAGGTVVTITGTAFGSATGVTFSGDSATYTVLSDTLIQAVSPAGTGAAVVTVQTPNGDAQGLFTYIPPSTPTIGSVAPASGPAAGGTIVTVTGTGLAGTTAVVFYSGGPLKGTGSAMFTVLSDDQLQVMTPPSLEPGTLLLEIQTPTGAARALFTYLAPGTPTIGTLNPASGPDTGGTLVTITGTGFLSTSDVYFDGLPANGYVVLSDSQIQAITPSDLGAATVPVDVRTSGGDAYAYFTYVPPNRPTIGSLNPPSGPDVGGTLVTITGTGLSSTSDVYFDGILADGFVVLSDTQIQAITPYDSGAGTIEVDVQTSNGDAFALYTYLPPQMPTISGLSPSSGPEAGDTLVVITGTGFYNVTDVSVNFDTVQYEVLGDSQILALTPPGTGTVPVLVSTPQAAAVGLFTYVPTQTPTISSLGPASGPEGGGTVVAIAGTAFLGATSIEFGGVAATSYQVLSDTLIEAVSPAGTGTTDLRVITPNGNALALFTYIPPAVPTIGSLAPASGPEAGGTAVLIQGTGFTGATDVDFGSNAALFTVVSDTQIAAVTPAGSGSVFAFVRTPHGQAVAPFTYIPPNVPTIGVVSPASGPWFGGTGITITGTGLTGATGVTFGGQPATDFTVLSDTSLYVVSPAIAVAYVQPATVVLQVETPRGAARSLFTYVDAPSISSLSPDRGPVYGGTVVTITGVGFTNALDVMFDGQYADFTVLSDTQIQAITPGYLLARGGGSDVPVWLEVDTDEGYAESLFTYYYP